MVHSKKNIYSKKKKKHNKIKTKKKTTTPNKAIQTKKQKLVAVLAYLLYLKAIPIIWQL